MIGSSVVPGLPKRCVTPSDSSNSIKALRPLIVFGVEGDVIQAARRTRVGALTLRYLRGRDNARQAIGAPILFAGVATTEIYCYSEVSHGCWKSRWYAI